MDADAEIIAAAAEGTEQGKPNEDTQVEGEDNNNDGTEGDAEVPDKPTEEINNPTDEKPSTEGASNTDAFASIIKTN